MTGDIEELGEIITEIVKLELGLKNSQCANAVNWSEFDWIQHRMWESRTRRDLNVLYHRRDEWEKFKPTE